MKEVEYFYGNNVYVAAIRRGYDGIFTRSMSDPNDEWHFLIPNTILWDSIQQAAYLNHKDFDSCSQEIIDTLPPLPPIPHYERKAWKFNFRESSSISIDMYPCLAKKLKESGGKITFWFVLFRDVSFSNTVRAVLWYSYTANYTERKIFCRILFSI